MTRIMIQNASNRSDNAMLVTSLPNELKHTTRIFGKINSEVFDLSGMGWGKPYEGFLDTDLKSKKGNVSFPMTILSPIALMGYPTYSTYQQGATDLFKISDGYSYTRHFKFDNGGFMESKHNIVRTDDGLVGHFEVIDASISTAGIQEIDPCCVETFYPSDKGRINSFFKLRWKKIDGSYLTADVNSEYFLKHDQVLPCVHFRMIKFMTEHSQNNLKQSEILSVFYDIEKINNLIID